LGPNESPIPSIMPSEENVMLEMERDNRLSSSDGGKAT